MLTKPPHESIACCCFGDLCNNSTDLEFIFPDDYSVQSTEIQKFTTAKSLPIKENASSSGGQGDSNLTLLITVPAVFFLLALCFTLLYKFFRHRPKSFNFPLHFRGSKSKCSCNFHQNKSSASACTCGRTVKSSGENKLMNGSANLETSSNDKQWFSKNELEGLGSSVKKVELISHGCFGQVWHGRYKSCESITSEGDGALKSMSELDVAVKIFRTVQKESWETEVNFYRIPGISHPNILKYYGADQVVNNESEPPELEFWLVTEYHELGSLHDFFVSHTLSWTDLLRLAIGIARGLSHLHSEQNSPNVVAGHHLKPSVAHRDLNSRNILLKNDLTACIADFGLAIRFEPDFFPSTAHPQLGTRRYMAPEVLDGAIQFTRDAYLRIDVYAMGLVFWELMSRCYGDENSPLEITSPYRAPFESELGAAPTIEELRHFIVYEKRRPKFESAWDCYPSMRALWETVEECWDQDAEARLSAGCVTERLTSLSHQPWSGFQPLDRCMLSSMPFGSGVSPLHPLYELIHSPTLVPTRTAPTIHSPSRAVPGGTVFFPVPSTSVPAMSSPTGLSLATSLPVPYCAHELPKSAACPPSSSSISSVHP